MYEEARKIQHGFLMVFWSELKFAWVARIQRKVSENFRGKRNIAIFILYLIYIIFVYKYEKILVRAVCMPSILPRSTPPEAMTPGHHHLL